MTVQAPITDTHIHLWKLPRTAPPMSDNSSFPPADIPWLNVDCLEADYNALPGGAKVDKVVVVEAIGGVPPDKIVHSNQWMIQQVEASEKLLSVVGKLDVTQPTVDFALQLDQLVSPVYVGLRIGSTIFLPDAEQIVDNLKPNVTDNLKELVKRGLMLDTIGIPVATVAEIAQIVPDTPIVINHWANKPRTFTVETEWHDGLAIAAQQPNINLKVSDTHKLSSAAANSNFPVQFTAITDPTRYTDALNAIWELYGKDRLTFGTNWPVSGVGELESDSVDIQINILEAFLADKGTAARNKVMYENALRIYGVRD